MAEKKTFIRFFTIADFAEEEIWLREQHKKGWKLAKIVPPCFYVFETCAPEDVIYRLDYKNGEENGSYFQMFQDYSWEYLGRCVGWLYFRKPAAQGISEEDSSLFSDNASKIDLIDHVCKTRLLPLGIIFLCCILPNLFKSTETYSPGSIGFTVFFAVMALLYIYMLLYCGLKLRKLRKQYRGD